MDKKDIKLFLGGTAEEKKKKKYNLKLREQNTERLREILDQHNRSLSEFMDFCIEDFLNKYNDQ